MRAAIPIFFLYLAGGFVPVTGDSPTVRATAAADYATCDPQSLPGATPHSAELRARLGEALRERGGDYLPRTGHRFPDGRPCYTNRLILEASPYLIQHAHNPVDWYAWGTEAFDRARRENKPVFLSIGYSTCHWCHVMERESFEDPPVARFLNEHFVAIKVDRERRPDIDALYMKAVMLTAGHGGWPMTSFLTPQGKPFLGGTYFPPDRFLALLAAVESLWTRDREELSVKADQIARLVERALSARASAGRIDDGTTRDAIDALASSYDEVQGGFSIAPKFPNEVYLLFLLDQAARGGEPGPSEMIRTTLDHMARARPNSGSPKHWVFDPGVTSVSPRQRSNAYHSCVNPCPSTREPSRCVPVSR